MTSYLRKTLIFLSIFSLSVFILRAQAPSRHQFVCSYYGEPVSGSLTGFASSPEAKKVIAGIMDVIGLEPTFQIRSANIPNAAAVISAGQRYILYNPQFINAINNAAKDKWASIAILAHEIGHHLNGHTLLGTGSRPSIELEADQFSGFVLRKMDASLPQAQKAMQLIGSYRASTTHPARTDRLTSIEKGWGKADEQMTGRPYVMTPKETETRTLPVSMSRTRYVLDPAFVKYDVVLSKDPNSVYHITTKNHFVTVADKELIVLGSMTKTNDRRFPYKITIDNLKMFLSSSGELFNASGYRVGYIKTPARV